MTIKNSKSLVGGKDTCQGTSSLYTKVEGIKEKGKVNR